MIAAARNNSYDNCRFRSLIDQRMAVLADGAAK
jgi:hypothetical protein